jgi:hypothetical protein
LKVSCSEATEVTFTITLHFLRTMCSRLLVRQPLGTQETGTPPFQQVLPIGLCGIQATVEASGSLLDSRRGSGGSEVSKKGWVQGGASSFCPSPASVGSYPLSSLRSRSKGVGRRGKEGS